MADTGSGLKLICMEMRTAAGTGAPFPLENDSQPTEVNGNLSTGFSGLCKPWGLDIH